MKAILSSLAIAAALTFLGAGAASGHHSFGFYDMAKTAEIEGVVSKFEWANPHCWLFVVVSAANGQTVTYGFEMRSPGEMIRAGWKKNTIQVGDKIKVSFRPLKDGAPAGLLMSAKDGSGAYIGRAPPTGPPPG